MHGGISVGSYVKPESIGDRSGNRIAYRQSHRTAVDNRTAVSLYLVDAPHECGDVEALLLYKNIKLASQFYYSHVAEGGPPLQYPLRPLRDGIRSLLPSNYRYNMGKSCVARPDDNASSHPSAMATSTYGQSGARSPLPGMHAASMQDLSVGLNYLEQACDHPGKLSPRLHQ